MKRQEHIHTNFNWRPLLYASDVPEKVLKSDFDWLDDPGFGFIQYRGRYYHTAEFMRIPNPDYWEGELTTTNTSGLVIKLSECGEMCQIAACY